MSDKPFMTYSALISLLERRGMVIDDHDRARRKLQDVGYYRLSGFWYPCRKFLNDTNGQRIVSDVGGTVLRRADDFLAGTTFNKVFALYLFDKSLRLLMLDALERVEICLRSLVAHEMGSHDPYAYTSTTFINPKWRIPKAGKTLSVWDAWSQKLTAQLADSREDCICWYRAEHHDIPIWVSVQIWEFGTLSKYVSMLNGRYQNAVCKEICSGLRPKDLNNWLHALNLLRNRCAHHNRIWNQSSMPLSFPQSIDYFAQNAPLVDTTRLAGLIAVLWFLIRRMGPASTWLNRVETTLNSMPAGLPNCNMKALGFTAGLHDTFEQLRANPAPAGTASSQTA
ncbi:MAG TPA: Abi family protein [Candidatus Avidesulfovibrio excrementigallinarum]|nr:Abi family protein [Candidatus Avidesulfovibrio excrementigallinarum]